MQKQQLESRPAEDSLPANASDVANFNLSSGGIKRFIKRESPLSEDNNGTGLVGSAGPVRINRAARLRAAATSATPPPAEDKSGKSLISIRPAKFPFSKPSRSRFNCPAVQRSKRLSVPTLEISTSLQSDGPSVDMGLSGETGVVMRQKAPSSSSSSSLQASSREKDKSTKRKSNLNRALTDEQILTPVHMDSQGPFNLPSS